MRGQDLISPQKTQSKNKRVDHLNFAVLLSMVQVFRKKLLASQPYR